MAGGRTQSAEQTPRSDVRAEMLNNGIGIRPGWCRTTMCHGRADAFSKRLAAVSHLRPRMTSRYAAVILAPKE